MHTEAKVKERIVKKWGMDEGAQSVVAEEEER